MTNQSEGLNRWRRRLTNMQKTILWSLLISCFTATAEQSLPEHLTSLPVLIRIPLPDGKNAAFGTGTYIDVSNKLFLVTATHVLFKRGKDNNLRLIGPNALLSTYAMERTNQTLVTLNVKAALDYGLLKIHPTHDVTTIRLATTYDYTNG